MPLPVYLKTGRLLVLSLIVLAFLGNVRTTRMWPSTAELLQRGLTNTIFKDSHVCVNNNIRFQVSKVYGFVYVSSVVQEELFAERVLLLRCLHKVKQWISVCFESTKRQLTQLG